MKTTRIYMVCGLAMLMLAGRADGQAISVRTSDPQFSARWVNVPGPGRALTLLGRSNGYSNGLRGVGTFEVAYSLVDEQGRLTTPGAPSKVVSTVRDWTIVANTPGIDLWSRTQGTMWWFRRIDGASKGPWVTLGAQENAQTPGQVTKPFVPICGLTTHGTRGNVLLQISGFPGYGNTFWNMNSPLTPPQAPSVTVRMVDNVALEVAYSWACNDGESPLSAVTLIPPFVHPIDPAYRGTGFHAPFELCRLVIPPQGALGVYLYLRTPGGAWHRQPSPTGANDFLWPIDFNRLPVQQYALTGIAPVVGRGRSWLSSLHLAMHGSSRDVIIDSDIDVCCPVISEWSGDDGQQKLNRTISTSNGGVWKLRDVGSTPDGFTGWPRAWPLWVENALATRVVGCTMQADQADTGIAFLDHVGGSAAMHFKFRDGTVNAPLYGVRCLWESRGPPWNDHSASEPVFRDSSFSAKWPMVVEGNQSANWVFSNTTANGSGTYDSAIATVANAGTVRFQGRLTCDNARCLLASMWCSAVSVENLFIDQGMPCWIVQSHNNGPRVSINGTKVNQWRDWLHVVECPSGGVGRLPVRLRLADTESQSNGIVMSMICASRAGMATVTQVDPVPILSTLVDVPVIVP